MISSLGSSPGWMQRSAIAKPLLGPVSHGRVARIAKKRIIDPRKTCNALGWIGGFRVLGNDAKNHKMRH